MGLNRKDLLAKLEKATTSEEARIIDIKLTAINSQISNLSRTIDDMTTAKERLTVQPIGQDGKPLYDKLIFQLSKELEFLLS